MTNNYVFFAYIILMIVSCKKTTSIQKEILYPESKFEIDDFSEENKKVIYRRGGQEIEFLLLYDNSRRENSSGITRLIKLSTNDKVIYVPDAFNSIGSFMSDYNGDTSFFKEEEFSANDFGLIREFTLGIESFLKLRSIKGEQDQFLREILLSIFETPLSYYCIPLSQNEEDKLSENTLKYISTYTGGCFFLTSTPLEDYSIIFKWDKTIQKMDIRIFRNEIIMDL